MLSSSSSSETRPPSCSRERRHIGAENDEPDRNDRAKKEEVTDEEDAPSNLQIAFKSLQSTTMKLVDELKKTTRFTVSAIAIQSSNTLLRLVRFIRNGK